MSRQFQPREEVIYVGKFDKEEIMVIEDDDNAAANEEQEGQTSPRRESLADKYAIGYMKIPPFRGGGGDINSSSESEHSETVDDGGYDFLSSSARSTSDNSSVGIQSNFIQRQILKQKSQGNWNSSIAPPAPMTVEGGDAKQPSSASAGREGERRSKTENGAGSDQDSASTSTSSSSEEDEDDNASSILDEPIRRSASYSSLASVSFHSLNEERRKQKSTTSSDTSSKASEDEKNQKGGDCGEATSEEAIQGKSSLGDANSKERDGGGIISVLEPVNNISRNNGMNTPNVTSDDGIVVKQQQNEGEEVPQQAQHLLKKSVKRTLSTNSLVAMLKIQPICERKTLQDDITKYNLAETVQIDASKSVATSDELDRSEISDKSVGNIDDGSNYDDNDDASEEKQEEEASDTISDDNSPKNSTEAEESIRKEPQSFSFIPFQPMDENESSNIVKRQNSSNIGTSIHSNASSDTFCLQSIHSANITHVSDAPDYDYYSISTSSSDIDEKEKKGKEESSASETNKNNTILNSDEQRTHHSVKEEGTASSSKIGEKQDNTAAIHPQQHTILPADPNSNAAKLSKEVCQVLGLPKDNVRKVHRGIMSRHTELHLRRMAAEKDKKLDHDDKSASISTAAKDAAHKNPLTPEANNTPMQDHSSNNDAESDDSSSEDLAFGPSNTGKGATDKWESIRLERQSSRQSMKKRRSLLSSSTTEDNPLVEEDCDSTTKHQPIRVIMATSHQPTRNVDSLLPRQQRQTQQPSRTNRQHETGLDYDDDSNSFASSTSPMMTNFTSKIGNMYRRFSGKKVEVNTSSLQYENSDDDESTSSSDEDNDENTPKSSQNILTEGEYYLAMSMLVYIYSLLRETSLLGHTDISFDEIDVNSFQSDPGFGGSNDGCSGSRSGVYSGSSTNKLLSKTKSAGFIIRVVMDELEKKGAFSSVEKNEGDMSVLREFKKWVYDSRSKQLDSATEKTIKELRRKVARRRWKRAIHAVRLMVRLGHSDSNSFALQLANKRRSSGRRNADTFGALRDSLTKSTENLLNSLRKPRIPRGLNESMMWMHDQRNQIMAGLGISGVSSQDDLLNDQATNNNLVGETEIKEIINSALEEPRFFLEGSLLSNLIESGIEVVWFGDRHPNDVVYSICANRQQKRVSVVFRGTVNSHNWLMNLKLYQTEHPNPIVEDYPGREDTFGLHTGFSLYMTRQRKDDSLTKLEEIFTNIDAIGREMCKDGDYELSITGHSLGGALATILAFYAACSNAFAKVKTIRCFTFAAPRVGCQRFVHAFQHLERIGKLRVARFTITRDIVPLIPFHGVSRAYKHVGMHIRLLGVDWYAQHWLRLALDVSYPKNHGFWSQLWRGLLSSFIRHLNTVQGYKRNHTLSEYQRRIRFALEYRSVLAQAGFFQNHKRRSRLKTLDEYYFIKGASNVTCTGELTRISLEDRAKESVRREARKSVIIIALVAILEAVALISVLRNLVPCENYPIFLYPLHCLTGCRKEESRTCSLAVAEVELPLSLEQNSAPAPPNEDSDADVSDVSSLASSVAEMMQQNISNAQTDNTSETDEARSQVSSPEENSNYWSSFWNGWLWDRPIPPLQRTPCVWGHCNFLSRPHLPWGTRIQHKPLPASITTSFITSSDSQQEQDEIWDTTSLALLQDVHLEVSHKLFALSKTVSQSNNKDQGELDVLAVVRNFLPSWL